MHLCATNLTFTRNQQILFADLNFSLTDGDCYLVEGANGSGKSTLLKIIAGLMQATAGEIFFNHSSLQKNKIEYFDHLHYLGHQDGNKLGLTIEENLLLAANLQQHEIKKSLTEILSVLHLLEKKSTLVKHLSRGQKRRVALAKFLLVPKKIWILDEPMTALDISIQNYFTIQMQHHLQQGGIIIVSTHQAINFSDASIKSIHLGNNCESR